MAHLTLRLKGPEDPPMTHVLSDITRVDLEHEPWPTAVVVFADGRKRSYALPGGADVLDERGQLVGSLGDANSVHVSAAERRRLAGRRLDGLGLM